MLNRAGCHIEEVGLSTINNVAKLVASWDSEKREFSSPSNPMICSGTLSTLETQLSPEANLIHGELMFLSLYQFYSGQYDGITVPENHHNILVREPEHFVSWEDYQKMSTNQKGYTMLNG